MLAWQKLLTSKIDEASEHLRRLESFFMENQLLVWHLRTQIGLALVDLIHQQPSQAKQRLQALDPSSDGIESPMDLYLLELLKNISELKVDNLESIDNMIWINVDNFKREDNSLRKSYGLSASQQRFSDHILDLTNIGSPRQIIIRTRSEEAIIEERSFDRESLSHFDVIFDEREQVLFVKGQKISLDGRSVLSNLVRIFLQNYDSDLSKEGLALIAWKESYHPLYHDNRIYTSIKRLRQLINPKLGVDFIEARDSAYAIRRDLSFAWIANYETRARLSDQQIFLLNHLQTNGSASRQEIQKLFRSSRTQTLRELKILLDRGSIRPYGSGRSVRYRLASESLSHLDGHVAKYLRRLTRKRFHIRLHLSR
ncbi:MAG: hypothetical protein GW917_03540 [Bdellovibrionales bacterium]|nr:hypothetical protein [Bdellovibrionales bacterium]